MNRFCIIVNREKDVGLKTAGLICSYLKERKAEAFLAEEKEDGSFYGYTDADALPENIDCAVVLGGDGTIIQAAHDLVKRSIPILGVNMGTLGFLAETERTNVFPALDALLREEYEIQSHTMLSADIIFQVRQKQQIEKKLVLNDLVITRSGISRLITIEVSVNGAFVNNYRGDGIILATSTGSTGYNLSAGGPVVTPMADLILITPICPHSLNARSIVVSGAETVSIKILKGKKSQEEEAIATFDGSRIVGLCAGDCIEVKLSPQKVKLVKLNSQDFFHILRSKLGNNGI